MSDTTTITAEERAKWRVWAQPLSDGQSCPEHVQILRLLDSLEQSEPSVMRGETRAETLRKRLMEQVEYTKTILARAEKAEAMVDWLADKMADTLSTDEDGRDVLTCPSRTLRPVGHNCDNITCQQCWKEAARRAVAAGEG